MPTDLIKENYNLAPLSTFKIGGPAKFFAEIHSKDELREALAWAHDNKEAVFFLGGGSNVLINDRGVDGLVLRFKNDNIEIRGERLYGGAGAALANLGRLAIANGLSGLEWVSGIPGATLGGSIRGNAGAFGVSFADLVETVEAYNVKKNLVELFSNNDCKFGYRSSFFKNNKNYLIWYATLRLIKKSDVLIKEKVEEVLKFREQKQPRLPSAGCVFKNVSQKELQQASPLLLEKLLETVNFREGNIGAGALIDMSGLKGKKIGGAKVSLEHASFIVNTGNAKAEDVITLISYIKQHVRDRFKVQLMEEIEYFGF